MPPEHAGQAESPLSWSAKRTTPDSELLRTLETGSIPLFACLYWALGQDRG